MCYISLCLLSPPMGRLKRNTEILVSSSKKISENLRKKNLTFVSHQPLVHQQNLTPPGPDPIITCLDQCSCFYPDLRLLPLPLPTTTSLSILPASPTGHL